MKELKKISEGYKNWISKENKSSIKEFNVTSVGTQDPKKHLLE